MNVGDLVMFRYCSQHGEIGIISMLVEPSCLAMKKPELQLYWVSFSGGNQCFTGNQLVLLGE